MPYITAKVADKIGTITLDHDRRRNALSAPLVKEVIAALGSFREAKVRVVILRARKGAKVCSAGHDVAELPESRRDPLGWDAPLRQLVREIENFPGPVIAMVEGSVCGGATETVFACDFIVATETATFAVTPAKLGVPYNVGGLLTLLNATGLRMAREMTFTGRPIDAVRAEHHGMINYVVPTAEIETFTLQLATQMAENAHRSAVHQQQRGLMCEIRRRSGSDGVHFWHWKVFDNKRWLARGNTFGSRYDAVRDAKEAIARLGRVLINAQMSGFGG